MSSTVALTWKENQHRMLHNIYASLLLTPLLLLLSTRNVCSYESRVFWNTVNNIAVGKQYVFVATENCLYQLDHTLFEVAVTSPRQESVPECTGGLQNRPKHIQQFPVYHNMLLLVSNDTVLSCWNEERGTCIERKQNNITMTVGVNSKQVVSHESKYPAAGILLVEKTVYLVVATFTSQDEYSKSDTGMKPISMKIKHLQNGFVNKGVDSYIVFKSNHTYIHFVDAFSWDNNFFFSYYALHGKSARIISLKSQDREQLEFRSLTDLKCDGGRKGVIVSSFNFIQSGGYFWAGIFTDTKMTVSPDNTALCIYNFTEIKERSDGCVNHDFSFNMDNKCKNYTAALPINNTPTLRHGNLTAVFAIEVQRRMVFFLGTGNGQLLKVILDSNWKANCPEIVFEFKEETPVFRTIKADPVDSSYLYVATEKKIKRIKVANCEKYYSCHECLLANDPFCGWCNSQKRCSLKEECRPSGSQDNWAGISDKGGKCLNIRVVPVGKKQLNMTAMESIATNVRWQCSIKNIGTDKILCKNQRENPYESCSCQFSTNGLSDNDTISVELVNNNNRSVSEILQFQNCHKYQSRCSECISSGCLWCTNTSICQSPLIPSACEEHGNEVTCRNIMKQTSSMGIPQVPKSQIKVTAINPEKMTYLGKQALTITGENLLQLQRVVLVGTSSCEPQDIKVSKVNDTQAILSLPQSRKEAKSICLNFDGNNCTETRNVYYESLPSCLEIFPNTTWLSGGRKISINGKNLNLMDDLILSYKSLPVNNVSIKVTKCKGNHMRCHFEAPPLPETKQHLILKIKVEDVFTLCGKLQYKNNPVFTSFSVFNDVAYVLELRIKKKHDDLNIQKDEIQVQIHYSNKTDPCLVQNITQSSEGSTVFCKATRDSKEKIEASKIKVTVTLGRFTVTLDSPRAGSSLYLLVLLVVPLLLIVILAAYLVTRRKSKEMSNKLSEQLERLECEVIQEIRDGFAELQMDKIDVTLKLGTIPFFVYKHFALKTLFPESEENKFNIIENLCEDIPSPFHTRSTMDEGENIPALRKLFENKKVLVLLIHTLEKQSTFSVKDRCMFASFLTINLQSNLVYLTEILEILIRDLMEESSNKHPKLMLRRTETVVEKLLTNWMSTCLYGFLRESVGEPLYLLVNTLNQRIHKGPIDVITCKALYTLNEDSLLWQMTEFSNVEINVNFPTISEIESEENPTQCIKVTVLDCDTIGQAKEKILQAFFNNKGYTFGASLCDICLELLHGQTQKELLDIDDSSVVLENGIRKLNTIKHYKVENGATINVVTKKNYDLPDIENSRKYCHLVLPNSEEAEDLGEQSKGKHKFKVKELYLTKLLSTKVAIHSSVEKLFQSIWTLPTNKPPVAIKHFFDFLDAQAENKKITDPDVLHIWKTNSLPLRFWVNILKNPQFVFDIKKTPLLESCLSVIAQAFMDSFSLAEQQLGKSAPTNKLLYAKDIPLFKEEVKTYYKVIRDAPPVSPMELKEFLMTESKKHEHEFKENVALLELYKYIDKYYNEILIALEKEPGFEEAHKQLLHIKALSEDKKKCKWEL